MQAEPVKVEQEACDHDCEDCQNECEDREEQVDFTAHLNEMSQVKKVIGIVSGKGGVGKSMITSLLAVLSRRKDYKVAILDADITGPSIPKIFRLKSKAMSSDFGIVPVQSHTGIEIMSMNLLIENDSDPVVWRGSLIGNMVRQFWTDVVWNEIDLMFLDMPPGTGDVALTVFQSLPVDGIVIVTSPQELVSLIVAKAVRMAEMMNIPIIAIVENMSYFKCPECQIEIPIFGDSHLDEIAKKYAIPNIFKVPLDPRLSQACDRGMIELADCEGLEPLSNLIENMEERI